MGKRQLEAKRLEDGERAQQGVPQYRTPGQLKEIRVFKVSRITSDIKFESKANSFEVPEGFRIQDHLLMLAPEPTTRFVARVRVGTCQSLRSQGVVTGVDGEWDRIEISLGNSWLEQLLWFGSDVVLEEPREKVAELIQVLRSKL